MVKVARASNMTQTPSETATKVLGNIYTCIIAAYILWVGFRQDDLTFLRFSIVTTISFVGPVLGYLAYAAVTTSTTVESTPSEPMVEDRDTQTSFPDGPVVLSEDKGDTRARRSVSSSPVRKFRRDISPLGSPTSSTSADSSRTMKRAQSWVCPRMRRERSCDVLPGSRRSSFASLDSPGNGKTHAPKLLKRLSSTCSRNHHGDHTTEMARPKFHSAETVSSAGSAHSAATLPVPKKVSKLRRIFGMAKKDHRRQSV